MKRNTEGRFISAQRETVRKLMRARRDRRDGESPRRPDRLDAVVDVLADRRTAAQPNSGGRA